MAAAAKEHVVVIGDRCPPARGQVRRTPVSTKEATHDLYKSVVPSMLISLTRRLLLCKPLPGLKSDANEKSGAFQNFCCPGVGLPGNDPMLSDAISLVDSGGVVGPWSTTIEGMSANDDMR